MNKNIESKSAKSPQSARKSALESIESMESQVVESLKSVESVESQSLEIREALQSPKKAKKGALESREALESQESSESQKSQKAQKAPKAHKEAVVLLNMGGANNLFEVELFLKNMFADPLILRIKSDFMRKIVASMIINARLEKIKKNYRALGGKSPITEITYNLTKLLNRADNSRFYTYSMRYVPPFARSVVEDLKARGITHITLFSMYPQYSTTTTLSAVRDFLGALKSLDYAPKVEIVESYAEDVAFVKSCVECIKDAQSNFDDDERFSDFVLLLSAHSIPQSVVESGDIYEREIEASANALKNALKAQGVDFKDIAICYQSKVGPTKWLGPSTIDMIKKFRDEKLLIYPLAFSIDNYETEFELEIDNRALADSLGVPKYIVCKCPNATPNFAKAIVEIILRKKKDINEAHI